MKTIVLTINQINDLLPKIDNKTLVKTIEQGFVAYSQRRATVPPVGHLSFKNIPADVHIKYGYIEDDDYYVIKVASGFYDNPKAGLPSSNGVMLVFSQKNGQLLGVLMDEGRLTDVRTAIAGAIAAKYLAPNKIKSIGIVGTGTQAKLQLQYLKDVTDCRDVYVWGRSRESLDYCARDMGKQGFKVQPTLDAKQLAENCNLIVTTTPSTKPLIMAGWIKAGTHITAVGADAKGKQELDPYIIKNADLVVVDSAKQCVDHGEIVAAIEDGLIPADQLVELGDLISNKRGRRNQTDITVADLTGVATQDIQIAKIIYELAAKNYKS